MTDDELLARLRSANCPQDVDQLSDALGSSRAAVLPALFRLCDADRVRLVRPGSGEFGYVPFEWKEPAHG